MISVIVPTLNEEKNLPAVLRNLLVQTGNYEVIVVDGGSTDRTRKIVSDFPAVSLLTGAAGRAGQMNRGADAASLRIPQVADLAREPTEGSSPGRVGSFALN